MSARGDNKGNKHKDDAGAVAGVATSAPAGALQDDLRRRNMRTLRHVGLAFLAMLALAYASVPLYDLFCRVTGFGGTTQVAARSDGIVLERKVTVRFNTDVASNLPWRFAPEVRKVEMHLGEEMLVSYTAENLASAPVAGTAIYNVTPLKAGKYFNKIECFCFGEQTLQPGQEVHMPVLFFVDPAMADDPLMRDVDTITLSYTFFRANSKELERGIDALYGDS